MNEVWLAFLLGTSSAAAPDCCLPAAPRFALQVDASKEARDNVLHFIGPGLITVSSYGTARYFGATRKQARWIAVGTSVVLVVAKELYDESVAGRFGLEEVAIGLGGTAAGLVVAEKLDWPERKSSDHPLLLHF